MELMSLYLDLIYFICLFYLSKYMLLTPSKTEEKVHLTSMVIINIALGI